jgi:hypothetical protein
VKKGDPVIVLIGPQEKEETVSVILMHMEQGMRTYQHDDPCEAPSNEGGSER